MVRQRRARTLSTTRHPTPSSAPTAYRFGCCSYALSTYAMMRRVFGSGGPPVDHTFEDLFVNFPDTPGDELADELGVDRKDLHLSKLEMRDRAFPGLADVPLRALVTVGHGHVPPEILASNKEYRAKREQGCGGRPKVRFSFWPSSGPWGRRALPDRPVGKPRQSGQTGWPQRSRPPFSNCTTVVSAGCANTGG